MEIFTKEEIEKYCQQTVKLVRNIFNPVNIPTVSMIFDEHIFTAKFTMIVDNEELKAVWSSSMFADGTLNLSRPHVIRQLSDLLLEYYEKGEK